MNQVRDRIDSELSDAEHELDKDAESGGIDSPAEMERSKLYADSDPEAMMRRAEARIAAARRDLESRTEAAHANGDDLAGETAPMSPSDVPRVPSSTSRNTPRPKSEAIIGAEADPNYHDYRVLGLAIGSDLAQVTAEYEKLSRRCDARRFPDGSAEQKQAEAILVRINAAYDALHRRLDPTENRFGKLELE